MKARYQQLSKRFLQRKPRERALWFFIALGAVILLLDTLLLEGQRADIASHKQAIERAEQQIGQLVAEQRRLSDAVGEDPNEIARRDISEREETIAELKAELAQRVDKFISPEQMQQVLRQLVQASDGVSLLYLESEPPRALSTTASENNERVDGAQVFSRGVRIGLTGNFHGLVAYLQMLENMPWVIGWSMLKIDASAYPDNRFELRLYTLSIDEEWLRV